MKHFLIPGLILFICLSTPAQQAGFNNVSIRVDNNLVLLYQQSHALLIGISDYSSDWPDLPGVKTDIYAVRSALEQHNFKVEIVENPTKQELDNAISNFIARNGQARENRLLFYFGGHGHTINTSYGGKLGYFVPADAPNPNYNEASFQSKAIEMAQIEIYAKRIQSKHALFIFDACFSGSLFATTRAIPEIISYKTTQPIRQFITSGTENEQVPDKSIFREQFVSALTSDMADGNKDGYLTGSELGEFLQSTVTNYSYNYQHPQFGKIRNPMLDKGDFVFLVPGRNMDIQTEGQSGIPVLGEAVLLKSMGGIELTTHIEGILFLDGQELGKISANSMIPIKNVTSGDHLLEIIGDEKWNRTVTVIKDQNTRLVANARSVEALFDLSRSGAFKDTRADREYRWVRIGKQVWMAENLDFPVRAGSWCYDNNENNCSKYGRLYDWETATRVCPDGWHLPGDEEWKELERALGMSIKESEKISFRGYNEGGKLKSDRDDGWKSPNKGSTDETGFTALPSGYRSGTGEYKGFFNSAIFWTSTENGGSDAYYRELYFNRPDIYRNYTGKINAFSVRCVKNNIIELH